MKKITTRQLEKHLDWLNDHMDGFNTGYAEYVYKKWNAVAHEDRQGLTILGITAAGFTDEGSDKLCEQLFNFTMENQEMLLFFYKTKKDLRIDDIDLQTYKAMFKDLINTYTYELVQSVKKTATEQAVLSAKEFLYKDIYKSLKF